ncbi:MAG: hypothetical protein HZB47_02460 [Nitrosomonadales bacterium]|nr:hypothetical protein [Nitrosomonadales bacterium]
MKRLKQIAGCAIAAVMLVLAMQATAETNTAGRDFNHLSTGFQLNGAHVTAACETCHVAGVFKGTPKECDGCHALGKRVVATPKSTSHIVTDAPCDTCHFNAATFLGARYNHGTAQPGQCMTCHNGRLSTAKPASHSSGNKATKSCDQCHRSFAWLPASWNHIGATPGLCGTQCHNGTEAPGQPPAHSSATPYNIPTKASYFPACDQCHIFGSWTPAPFKHLVAGTCDSCHTVKAGHLVVNGASCDTCHRSKTAWLPAAWHSGNEAGLCLNCHNGTTAAPYKSSKHIPYTGALSCDTCHIGTTTWTSIRTGATLHGYVSGIACYTCHGSNTAYSGAGQQTASWPNFHESGDNPSATDCSASGCHRPAGNNGSLYIKWN